MDFSPSADALTILETLVIEFQNYKNNGTAMCFTAAGTTALWGLIDFGINNFNSIQNTNYFGYYNIYINFGFASSMALSGLLYLFMEKPLEKELIRLKKTLADNPHLDEVKRRQLIDKVFKTAAQEDANSRRFTGGILLVGASLSLSPLLFSSYTSGNTFNLTSATAAPLIACISMGIYTLFFSKGPIEEMYENYQKNTRGVQPKLNMTRNIELDSYGLELKLAF